MSKSPMVLAAPLVLAFGFCPVAWSQETGESSAFAPAAEGRDWQYEQDYEYQPDPRFIIHQKAQWRGQQRMGRLAAMRWYGMYNGRPIGAPTPFTSMYSPAWQMPGGRPNAWHTRGTTVIVTRPESRIYR